MKRAVWLLVLLIFMCGLGSTAYANDPAPPPSPPPAGGGGGGLPLVVSAVPSATLVEVGDVFDVSVYLHGVNDLYGASLELVFDPDVVSLIPAPEYLAGEGAVRIGSAFRQRLTESPPAPGTPTFTEDAYEINNVYSNASGYARVVHLLTGEALPYNFALPYGVMATGPITFKLSGGLGAYTSFDALVFNEAVGFVTDQTGSETLVLSVTGSDGWFSTAIEAFVPGDYQLLLYPEGTQDFFDVDPLATVSFAVPPSLDGGGVLLGTLQFQAVGPGTVRFELAPGDGSVQITDLGLSAAQHTVLVDLANKDIDPVNGLRVVYGADQVLSAAVQVIDGEPHSFDIVPNRLAVSDLPAAVTLSGNFAGATTANVVVELWQAKDRTDTREFGPLEQGVFKAAWVHDWTLLELLTPISVSDTSIVVEVPAGLQLGDYALDLLIDGEYRGWNWLHVRPSGIYAEQWGQWRSVWIEPSDLTGELFSHLDVYGVTAANPVFSLSYRSASGTVLETVNLNAGYFQPEDLWWVDFTLGPPTGLTLIPDGIYRGTLSIDGIDVPLPVLVLGCPFIYQVDEVPAGVSDFYLRLGLNLEHQAGDTVSVAIWNQDLTEILATATRIDWPGYWLYPHFDLAGGLTPGEYRVVVTVNGQASLPTAFDVVADPLIYAVFNRHISAELTDFVVQLGGYNLSSEDWGQYRARLVIWDAAGEVTLATSTNISPAQTYYVWSPQAIDVPFALAQPVDQDLQAMIVLERLVSGSSTWECISSPEWLGVEFRTNPGFYRLHSETTATGEALTLFGYNLFQNINDLNILVTADGIPVPGLQIESTGLDRGIEYLTMTLPPLNPGYYEVIPSGVELPYGTFGFPVQPGVEFDGIYPDRIAASSEPTYVTLMGDFSFLPPGDRVRVELWQSTGSDPWPAMLSLGAGAQSLAVQEFTKFGSWVKVADLQIVGGTVSQIEVQVPGNLPIGTYSIDLFADGSCVGWHLLQVRPAGIYVEETHPFLLPTSVPQWESWVSVYGVSDPIPTFSVEYRNQANELTIPGLQIDSFFVVCPWNDGYWSVSFTLQQPLGIPEGIYFGTLSVNQGGVVTSTAMPPLVVGHPHIVSTKKIPSGVTEFSLFGHVSNVLPDQYDSLEFEIWNAAMTQRLGSSTEVWGMHWLEVRMATDAVLSPGDYLLVVKLDEKESLPYLITAISEPLIFDVYPPVLPSGSQPFTIKAGGYNLMNEVFRARIVDLFDGTTVATSNTAQASDSGFFNRFPEMVELTFTTSLAPGPYRIAFEREFIYSWPEVGQWYMHAEAGPCLFDRTWPILTGAAGETIRFIGMNLMAAGSNLSFGLLRDDPATPVYDPMPYLSDIQPVIISDTEADLVLPALGPGLYEVVITGVAMYFHPDLLRFEVSEVPAIVITPVALPSGTVGLAYDQQLAASGGVAPYTWSVASGALPGGLSLSPSGVLSGTPTATGQFSFTVQAADNAVPARSAVQSYEVSILGTAVVAAKVSGSPGSTVVVPISVKNAAGMAGGQFEIHYDPSVAVVTLVELGTLLADSSMQVNMDDAATGCVIVGFMRSTGVEGDGELFRVIFEVTGEVDDVTTVGLWDVLLNGEDGADIPSNAVNGEISIGVIYGDLNNDGRVTAADATLALRAAVRLITLDSRQTLAADVNGDGRVTAADATLILRYAVRLISTFPVQG